MALGQLLQMQMSTGVGGTPTREDVERELNIAETKLERMKENYKKVFNEHTRNGNIDMIKYGGDLDIITHSITMYNSVVNTLKWVLGNN